MTTGIVVKQLAKVILSQFLLRSERFQGFHAQRLRTDEAKMPDCHRTGTRHQVDASQINVTGW